jgi:hypothetical protein
MGTTEPNSIKMSNTKTPLQRLMAAQMEIQAIVKDKINLHFKKYYADINTMLAEVKPALHKHGLFIIQPIEEGHVITRIIDSETGNMLCESSLQLSGQGNPQQRGSEITYYRRYTLQSLMALEAEDDDANSASTPAPSAPAKSDDNKPWLDAKDEAYQKAMEYVKGKGEQELNRALARLSENYKVNKVMREAMKVAALAGMHMEGGQP